jgi:transcriptional regulator with XRE-family HTH domain
VLDGVELFRYRKEVPRKGPPTTADLQRLGDLVQREFGRRLGELRKGKGLKQLAFGRQLGLSRTSISNIERGEQRVFLELAYQAAYLLGVSPQALLPTLEDVAVPAEGTKVHTASDELPLVPATEKETLKLVQELQKHQKKRLAASKARKEKRS